MAQTPKAFGAGHHLGRHCGLGTITPASSFVLPWHAIIIGIAAGAACFWACIVIKPRLGYDDSLDVFGVHGVGGTVGTLLTGVFAVAAISAGPDAAAGFPGLIEGNPRQLLIQLVGVVVAIAWSGIATFALLKFIGWFTALRVSREAELTGLDITLHGEALQ